MAMIPMSEDLGRVQARSARAPGIVQGAHGEGIGVAMQRAGAVAQHEAMREMHQLKLQAEAADRAKADGILQTADAELATALDEFDEGIKGGAIDKKQAHAEWQTRSTELISSKLQQVPEALREQVKERLHAREMVFRRGISKAVVQREQSDVRAGLDQTLETASRLYITQPQQAEQLVSEAFAAQGAFSGLDAQQLGRMQQSWREATRFNRAATLVQEARSNNGQLDKVAQALNGEQFADLTPERRLQLTTQIEGFKTSNIQRAEAARARAEAQARAHLEHARAAFDAAQGLVATGKTLRPDYIEQLTKATVGTPFAKALPDLVRQGPEGTAFATQPLAVQRQALQQARAKLNSTGTTPEVEKQVARLEAIYTESVRDYDANPLRAAQERGLIEDVAPLNTADLPSIVASLGQRVEQARVVQGVVGRAVSPLMPEEAEQLAAMLQPLPVAQKASALAELSQAVGPAISKAISQQIAAKDKATGLAMAMSTSKTTQGRYSSELVLRGAQAIRDKSVKEDNTALTGVRAQAAELVGDALTGSARDAAIDAATLIYYGKEAEGDRTDVANALRLAIGGVTERAGRKVVLPYGMTESQFDQRLRSLTPQTLATQLPDGKVYVGKTPLDVDAFIKQVPKAGLITSGAGRYGVQAGGGMVTNSLGKPVYLEIQ